MVLVQFPYASGTAAFDDLKVLVAEPPAETVGSALLAPAKTSLQCIDLSRYYNVSLTNAWHFGVGQSDLSGWSPYEKGRDAWSVKDGLLTCDPSGGTLAWGGTLDDFKLRFSYKFNFARRIAPGDAG